MQPLYVLLTGATGFLGRNLLAKLKGGPYTPLILVKSLEHWQSFSWTKDYPEVKLVYGELADPHFPDLENILPIDKNSLKAIIHLAAVVRHSRKNAKEVYDVNITGTKQMVVLSKEFNCPLIFISTAGTVGCFKEPQKSANEDAPFCTKLVQHWPYYHSKILAEKAAINLAEQLNSQLIIIRLPVLLGPDDHRGRSTGHIRKFLQGELPFLVKGGIQIVDVRDVATALVNLLSLPLNPKKAKPDKIYHLAGYAGPIDEFFQLCNQFTSKPQPIPQCLPAWFVNLIAIPANYLCKLTHRKPFLPDTVLISMAAHWWAIHSAHAQELHFTPRPLAETLKDTINWLESTS